MSKTVTRTFAVQYIEEVGPGTRLYRFRHGLAPLQFLPGQFALTCPQRHPQRAAPLTFACAPGARYFELLVKQTGGFGSQFYADTAVGDLVRFGTSSGTLAARPDDLKRPIVFFARDYCLAALRAYLQWLTRSSRQEHPVVLFHELSSPEEKLFAVEFMGFSPHQFQRVNLLAGAQAPPGWSGECGEITAQLVRERVPNWREARYLIQAEAADFRRFQGLLKQLGVAEAQVSAERWS